MIAIKILGIAGRLHKGSYDGFALKAAQELSIKLLLAALVRLAENKLANTRQG